MDARAIDQPSITYFGRRTMNINLPSIDNLDQAQTIADFERGIGAKPPLAWRRRSPCKAMPNAAARAMPINWDWTIGSLVRLRETQTDHEGTYFIIGEAQELARGWVHWTTTWYLEPQVETLPWRLDDGSRSQLDMSAYLAY